MNPVELEWVTQRDILESLDKDEYLADALEDNLDARKHILKTMLPMTASAVLNVVLMVILIERADLGFWHWILILITMLIVGRVQWLLMFTPPERTLRQARILTGHGG